MRRIVVRARSLAALMWSSELRAQWRKERFLKRARKYVPALAVDDRRGNRYLVPADDPSVGRRLFVTGAFDVETLDNALAILTEFGLVPDQVVDIGANIGTTTIDLLSRLPNACAVAFEPDPDNFCLLRQNLIGNDLSDRVTVHRAALSDADGVLTLERNPGNPGDYRVRVGDSPGRYGEEQWNTETVSAWRLDTLVERGVITLDKATLLWIDAQGHEAHILAGAQRFAHLPMALEFWPYGLRRAGGYHAFLEAVRSCPNVFDLRRDSTRLDGREVAALGADLEARGAFTDLLLIPNR